MRYTLVYTARADNVDIAANVLLDIVLGKASADLHQERLPIP